MREITPSMLMMYIPFAKNNRTPGTLLSPPVAELTDIPVPNLRAIHNVQSHGKANRLVYIHYENKKRELNLCRTSTRLDMTRNSILLFCRQRYKKIRYYCFYVAKILI